MTTPSPDYEHEAARYDATRGGPARADAAAAAAARLLPAGGTVLDVGGGTGLVASRLEQHGFRVVVVDASPAMLALAVRRTSGVVRADAARLPFRDRSVDGVVVVWLLHLLPDAAPVLAECARVLRPAGRLVTTVDKAHAHGYDRADPEHATDARRRVLETCARLGLVPAGETSFVGHGQGTGRGAGEDGGPDPVFPLLAFRRQPRRGEVSVAGPTVPA